MSTATDSSTYTVVVDGKLKHTGGSYPRAGLVFQALSANEPGLVQLLQGSTVLHATRQYGMVTEA